MTGFSVSMLLWDITTGNNLLGDASLEDYKLTLKIKPREMRTKLKQISIALWTKLTEMREIKHTDIIDVIPLLPCLNLSWKMGWRIYGGGRTQTHLSSPATIDPLGKIQG